MQRKVVIFLSLLLIVVLAFSGCKKNKKENIYQKLNRLTEEASSSFTLYVSTTQSGETLTSKFTVRNNGASSTVDYEHEVFSSFEEEGGVPVIPEGYTVKKTGTVTLENGNLLTLNGDPIDVDFSSISTLGIRFDAGCLSNVVERDVAMYADVTNVPAFLGTALSCRDMSVIAEYSTEQLSTISISYVSENGAQVTYRYSFL